MPALIFFVSMMMSTLFLRLPIEKMETYHFCFYGICLFNTCFALWIKNHKSALFTLLLLILYLSGNHAYTPVSLNSLKLWLLILVPMNLFLIFQMPDHHAPVFWPLLFFIFEGCLLENLYLSDILDLPFIFSLLAGFFWAGTFCYMLIKISYAPTFIDNTLFFSSILIFFALTNYGQQSTRIFCFLGAALMTAVSAVYSSLYSYYRDTVTGVYSLHSFKKHDQNSNKQHTPNQNKSASKTELPTKYRISFFYIDNYNKILKVFGQKQTDLLTIMILKRISTLELNALTYRLKPNEFCFIFKDLDIKETYEQMENVRRLIASTEFVLPSKKVVKITITPAVSEKLRTDKNAEAVLNRMYEMFYPRYRFTQNMTFCEEIEKSRKKHRL